MNAIITLTTDFGLTDAYVAAMKGVILAVNPETKISYHLPQDSAVRLEIYNSLGRLVSLLDSGQKRAGVHTLVWNARDMLYQRVSSGIYYCRLVAGKEVRLIKMLLLQ